MHLVSEKGTLAALSSLVIGWAGVMASVSKRV